ncbi:MAG TPA: hypothetical protein VLX60_15795 [Terriglobales bacterium]|nr:hypothetical protein [Terriglobales bacterium]
MDRTEAGKTGPSQDVSENGFGLIIHRVRCSDAIGCPLRYELLEECVTSATPCIFEIGLFTARLGGDIGVGHVNGKTELFRESGYEFFVRVGSLSAESVIEMDHAQNDAEFFAQLQKQMQQGNRIRTARNGHTEPLAGAKPTFIVNMLKQTLG